MRVGIVGVLLVAMVAGLAMTPPVSAGDSGLFVSADWINWKARQRGMDFVIVDPNDDTDPQGNQIGLNYDRDSGARVVLGYHLGPCWDFTLEYQGYDTSDRMTVNQPVGGNLWSTRVHPDSVIASRAATSATGRAVLNYDVIDLMLARQFAMDCCQQLNLTLFGGFRYAMVDQTMDITYVDTVNSVSADIHNPIKLDGYGIRGGGRLDWNVCGGWTVFGQGALSVLAARTNAIWRETDVTGTGTTIPVDVSETYYQAVPVIETALGVAYQCDRWEVGFGYEMSLWGNVGERRDFTDDVDDQHTTYPSNDLLLDGFFLRFTFNR